MISKNKFSISDGLFAISLANICHFKNLWLQFGVGLGGSNAYYLYAPKPLVQWALLANIAILAVIIWGLILSVRDFTGNQRESKLQAFVYLLLGCSLVFPLIAMGREIQAFIGFPFVSYALDNFSKATLILALGGVSLPLLYIYFRFSQVFIVAFRVVLLSFSPFVFVTLMQMGTSILNPFSSPKKLSSRAEGEGKVSQASPRLLWLVFDEMDQILTFSERLEEVKIPNLSKLVGESFYATHALSPDVKTLYSIPKLITGKQWAKISQDGANDLKLHSEANKDASVGQSWKAYPSVFSKMSDRGLRSGLLGVYHPYCRLFGKFLETCETYNHNQLAPSATLWGNMWNQLRQLPLRRHAYFNIENYKHMLPQGLELVANKDLDFVFIHWLFPHPPWIYDFRSETFKISPNSNPEGYFHNLALVDRTLGELRRRMEETGTWEKTIVLMTSDHHYREASNLPKYGNLKNRVRRVPFVVKIPGDSSQVVYDSPFGTELVVDLTMALQAGLLKTHVDIKNWIQKRSLPNDN